MKNNKAALWVSIGAVVVGGSVLAYYLYYKKNKVKNADTNKPLTTSAAKPTSEYDSLVKRIGLSVKKVDDKIQIDYAGGMRSFDFTTRNTNSVYIQVDNNKYAITLDKGTELFQDISVISENDGKVIKTIKITK